MRKFTKECNAEHASHITSTKLRKHIATLSQVMNLKDNELDNLASFLGHGIKIHREYRIVSTSASQYHLLGQGD